MRRALLFALLTLCACGSSAKDANNDGIADGTYKPNDVTMIAPSTPKGNVAGTVLDAEGNPLAGATAKLSLDGVNPATTDSTGHFSFTGVAAGSAVGVTLSKDGFTTAYAQATVPSAAGNVPINDATAFVGPIRLFATSGKLNVSVVGYDGKLLGPTAVLQISPAYIVQTDTGNSLQGWTVSRATGSNGVLSFSGVPELAELARFAGSTAAGSLSIAVDPLDADGDGKLDYGGATLQLSVADAMASPGSLSVVLPPVSQGQGALKIVGSSCGTLVSGSMGGGGPAGSLIAPSDKVYVAFNQRIVPGSLSIQVLDDDGSNVSAAPEIGATGTVVDFTGAFNSGHALTVKITATPADSRPATPVSFAGTCFVQPAGSSPTVTKAIYTAATTATPLAPGDQVRVEFDSAIGYEGGTPVFAAYIDADLDGDGKRQSTGEYDPLGKNTSPGFTVTYDPSKPTALNGHFGRFFQFSYGGSLPVNANKAVYFYFNDPRTPGATPLEWATGAALGPSNPPAGFLTPVVGP